MPAAFSPLPPHNGSSQRHVPVSVIGTGRKLYGSVWVSWPGRCAEGSSPDWSRSLDSGTEVSRKNPRGVLSARIILPTITATKLSLPFLSPSILFWTLKNIISISVWKEYLGDGEKWEKIVWYTQPGEQ